MKDFNEIQQLRANAKEFENFWRWFKNHTNKPHIDKYGAQFGGDSRFTNFKVVTFFESHIGEYGNPSCSTFGRFDGELAQTYMVRAMNCMKEELFAKCAELMRADAAKKVIAAKAEVEAMQAALDACLTEAPEATHD